VDESDGRVPCATYTHARRHPMVLGKIGDWTPPFQLTMAQVAVLLVVLLIEVQTWRYWGPRLNPVLAMFVFIGLPGGLAWAVRKARIEGRSLPRAVAAWLIFLARPRSGRVGGRTYRSSRPATLAGYRTYVAEGPASRPGTAMTGSVRISWMERATRAVRAARAAAAAPAISAAGQREVDRS
jgi:hypothetical protein